MKYSYAPKLNRRGRAEKSWAGKDDLLTPDFLKQEVGKEEENGSYVGLKAEKAERRSEPKLPDLSNLGFDDDEPEDKVSDEMIRNSWFGEESGGRGKSNVSASVGGVTHEAIRDSWYGEDSGRRKKSESPGSVWTDSTSKSGAVQGRTPGMSDWPSMPHSGKTDMNPGFSNMPPHARDMDPGFSGKALEWPSEPLLREQDQNAAAQEERKTPSA